MSKSQVKVVRAVRNVLITGASIGIGAELAREFAERGNNLILVARSADKLNALKASLEAAHGIKVSLISMDLAVPGAAVVLFERVKALGVQIDDLINNAGVGTYGRFTELNAEEDARMLQLNMIFLTELTRLVGKDMATRRSGRILNVASTAAFQPGPMMATYYASKAYVLSLSEALGSEFADYGVTVTAICPGPTISGFQSQAKMEGARMLKMMPMSTTDVARQAVKAFDRGSAVKITGFTNTVLAQSVRFTPRCLVTRLSRFFADRAVA